MSNQYSDQERFRRIRDRQITARDPQKKQRRQQREIAQRHRRSRQRFSLGTVWSQIPHRWRGILYGGLIGIGIILILPLVSDSSWVPAISAVAFLFLMILGFFIGRAIDTRDSLKDLMR